jgi:hypothetical protein
LVDKWTGGWGGGGSSALPFVINAPAVKHERPSAIGKTGDGNAGSDVHSDVMTG